MFTSAQAVIDYLESIDLGAAEKARHNYACFDQFNKDPEQYGLMASMGLTEHCAKEAVKTLMDLLHNRQQYIEQQGGGYLAVDNQFAAEMNARLVKDAEEYYRTMIMVGFKGVLIQF
jgi:erythromycin esterase-like protein